jgi:hypothetical protein
MFLMMFEKHMYYAWLSHNTDENDKVHALLLAKYIRTDTTYSLMCNICQNYQNWNQTEAGCPNIYR